MAHYIAETIQEAENAQGNSRDAALERAVDLILRIWTHRRSLPRSTYPLNDFERVLSIAARLSPDAWPYMRLGNHGTEQFLARIFYGLQHVVVCGVVLISEVEVVPNDLDDVIPFLEENEHQVIESIRSWIEHAHSGRPQPPHVSFSGENTSEENTEQSKEILPNNLDPRSRSIQDLSAEIEELIENLTQLKKTLSSQVRAVDKTNQTVEVPT